MQLDETLLNASNQLKIHNHMDGHVVSLSKMKFHQLLLEDGMSSALRNPEMWLRDVTTKLNQFANQL